MIAIIGSDWPPCDEEGQCKCKPNFEGEKCDKCANGYFGLPDCTTGT